jgi:hypothetical protein
MFIPRLPRLWSFYRSRQYYGRYHNLRLKSILCGVLSAASNNGILRRIPHQAQVYIMVS